MSATAILRSSKAALAALVKITRANGTIIRYPTDEHWKASLEKTADWKSAQVVAELSDQRLGDPGELPQPAAYLRRTLALSKDVQSARLYVTALGSYRVFLNGSQIGGDVLTPDFTDYRKRVLYQTYDVTSLLVSGNNVIGALLGDGWYGSGLTWVGMHFFSPPDRFVAQLELNYADGSHDTVVSDESWKESASPILRSDIYAGETYDARLEQSGWERSGFDDSKWRAAVAAEAPKIAVTSQITAPARIISTLDTKGVTAVANGAYIFDMGQNMVGWVTLKVKGTAGTKVRLRFAEILNPDGTIYTANLRNADATDVYTLRGGEEETFAPHFTFHGFRYVEVTGYPGTPALDAIECDVVRSVSGDPVAKLTTSSDLVNQMWSIGIWGQRGNFLSIPTDCPQRDERLGWMGDAGVFWRTGSYNFDIASFSQKFIQDIVDAQTTQGAFTNVSPNTLPFGGGGIEGTWLNEVKIVACPPAPPVVFTTFPSMITYIRGGTVIEGGSPSEPPAVTRSSGHGIWKPAPGHSFHVFFRFHSFDNSGRLVSITEVTTDPSFVNGDLVGGGTNKTTNLNPVDGSVTNVTEGCNEATSRRLSFGN